MKMSEYLGVTVGFVTVLACLFWAGSINARRRRMNAQFRTPKKRYDDRHAK
jgi:hypothetical protein